MRTTIRLAGLLACGAVLGGFALYAVEAQRAPPPAAADAGTVRNFGAVGDGHADDTAAIERAVRSGIGHVRFPKGIYRITRPIEIDLARVGYISLDGAGVAQVVMAAAGPAFRFVGSHEGTAAPQTVHQKVWRSERTPLVDGLEIIGEHPQACGIEAAGTMQLTLTRLVVRDALHAVHLAKRNRNVILSECHLYNNRGIGLFLDAVNLHQINVVNCHISYNDGGGVVSRASELRNLQIGACDIEGNMGGPDSEPTANVLLDSAGASAAEVAIVGCTIQHAHDAPDSANIRIDCQSVKRPFTDELRHGNITIADNILSDVQTNVEVRRARAVTITGNTMWQGYQHNLVVDRCANVVVANNVFDRNPRYHYGAGAEAQLDLVFTDSSDVTLAGNHVYGVGDVEAAVLLRRCQRMNVTGCTILDFGRRGLWLDDVRSSRVSDCLIRDDRPEADGVSLQVAGGGDNQIVDNHLGTAPRIDEGSAVAHDNLHP